MTDKNKPKQPPRRKFTVEVTYDILPGRHTYTEICVARTPDEAKTIARRIFNEEHSDRYIFESAEVLP